VAQTFLKAEKIISQGLGLLQRELVLAGMVGRYTEADFRGAKNDTITIRIPSLLKGREYEWRTRTAPIEIDELNEYSVPVTLDIMSWGEQVARPQIRAVAEVLEGYIATAMENANYRHEVDFVEDDPEVVPDSRAFYRAAVKARQYLNMENVPASGRVIVLGANAEAAALNSGHIVKANESDSDSALREAIIGRIAGFTVIGNINSVDPDFAVAMHPTAFALANVAPVVPDGASAGARMVFDSLAMRWIRDYDSDYLRDRSVYSAFAGAASIEDGRDLTSDVDAGFGELTNENVRAVRINFTGIAGS